MAHTAHRGSPVLEGLELPERYEVRRRIATGGMASVWCARDRALGRSVAIKLLSMPFARDSLAVRRFKREARAQARLSSHSHVVTIYDVGHAAEVDEPIGRPFIVMEYLAGGTLADALRVREVTREQAVRWLHEAASALDHAHARGVIHRDIKPVNFLLDGGRVLHVADFGIAQLGTEDTFGSTGQVMGTAAYIAPEQVVGRPATEASDRYSLAVTAFELLVGERPFQAENFAAQARQHLEEEPPPASRRNPRLPRSLDAVLARGLAKQPQERWPTAGQFAGAVEAALVQAPVPQRRRRRAEMALGAPARAAASEPAAPRLYTTSRSRRGPALAALAAGVIGVVVAAIASGALSGGSGSSRVSSAHAGSTPAKVASTSQKTAKKKRRSSVAKGTSSSTTAPATVTASPAAATTNAPTADTLESRGHQLMESGNYSGAVPVLQKAVSTASPGSPTYAYALFDLGRSLRLAGDPKAAIPVLWQRMKIPNQTDVVRTELQAALRAVGAQVNHGGGAAPPPGHGPGGGPPGHSHGGGPGSGNDQGD